MNKSKTVEFQGENYFDDRLFVLYLCEGEVETTPDSDGVIWTTIYHENPPKDHVWCVVTYRNSPGYPIARVDHFTSRERAVVYMWHIEPEVPLISLGGKSPANPLPYQSYLSWKKINNLKEFDFHNVYMPGGNNAREMIAQSAEHFNGIN